VPSPNRLEERPRLFAEEREQQELFVARGQALRLGAELVEVDRLRLGNPVRQ